MIERWVQHITDPDASAAEIKKQLERVYEAAKSYQRDPDEETSRLASAICMNISLVLLNIENDTDPQPRLRTCANGLRGFNV
ncbi:MAG: hypothetical protein ACOYW9_08015 [Deinococcota bacterium]